MEPTDLAENIEFPSLEPGITLLSMDDRATGALQSLILDHLLLYSGDAYWVDARNNAVTTTLSQVAPSMRVLDRIQVARAFTAFQHHSLVTGLTDAVDTVPSIIVLPDVDWFYTGDDLARGEGQRMLTDVLEMLTGIATDLQLPVAVSRAGAGEAGDQVAAAAETVIECTLTQFGPRFSGSEFETLMFDCGTGVQTTLAFWQRVLHARHPQQISEPGPEVSAIGSH